MDCEVSDISFVSKEIKLLGVLYFGDPFHNKKGWDTENEIGKTWKRFDRVYKKHKEYLKTLAVDYHTAYEVHIEPTEYNQTKEFYVFIGIEVTQYKEIPVELFCKPLPNIEYAIFKFKGKNITCGSQYIWNEWLPNSGYIEGKPYLIQKYGREFKGMEDPDSVIEYLVPVIKKGDNP
ncbi:MAG: GyrI-like domain-containing protein [Candidatus Heimdallarchaeota archaeon]|nr:GyrI-like domain-containing protein [Candidatus Heimdallarchaeota archaeon]